MPERRTTRRNTPDRHISVARRNSRRVIEPLRIPVFWNLNGQRKDGFVYDIGLGGCFLNTSGSADIDDEIVLEVPRPPGWGKGAQISLYCSSSEETVEGLRASISGSYGCTAICCWVFHGSLSSTARKARLVLDHSVDQPHSISCDQQFLVRRDRPDLHLRSVG